MTLILALLVELAILVWAFKRAGIMPFPHGFMVYLMGAQIFVWLNAYEIIDYEFLSVWSTGAYRSHLQAVTLMLFIFFVAAAACVPKGRFDLFQGLKKFENQNTFVIVAVIIFALYIEVVAVFLTLDWGLVWYNQSYMSMASPRGRDAISSLILQTGSVFGVVTSVLTAYLLSKKQWALLIWIVPLFAWHVLFGAAGHSRGVVLYLITAGLTLLYMRNRVLPPILLFGAVVALLGALSGRAANFHGFSSLPFFISNIFQYDVDVATLTNIFEGAFVTAEYFNNDLQYDRQYALLSLSPLFSFIDGFDLLLRNSDAIVLECQQELVVAGFTADGDHGVFTAPELDCIRHQILEQVHHLLFVAHKRRQLRGSDLGIGLSDRSEQIVQREIKACAQVNRRRFRFTFGDGKIFDHSVQHRAGALRAFEYLPHYLGGPVGCICPLPPPCQTDNLLHRFPEIVREDQGDFAHILAARLV